ncbi:response regulator transcription factor [Paraburkholderia kururiensis]|uniref:response regulator transcription factor n=1 Tax=Paraburkholderia kururiensis TaxID=984307 RepID=UPI0005AA4D08|nr:response regulator transcription factor [Paraburkholderia kururiensis]
MRIAILAADVTRADFAVHALLRGGHTCRAFFDGVSLAHALERQALDLVVIDWDMSRMRGEVPLEWVRQRSPARTPVLCIVPAGGAAPPGAIGDAPVDRCVIGPLSAAALLGEVDAMLARALAERSVALATHGANGYAGMNGAANGYRSGYAIDRKIDHRIDQSTGKAVFGDFEFDFGTRAVFVKGRAVTLTQKEFSLALLLFQCIDASLSREQIFEAVWPSSAGAPSRTMDTHISVVRTKLGLRPENGYRLSPIYGYGYRLEQLVNRDKA